MDSDKRQKTKAKRTKAFKAEQQECTERLRGVISAVVCGNMSEVDKWMRLVGASIEYLKANDPERG